MKMGHVPASIVAFAFLMTFAFFAGCSDNNHDNPGVRVRVNGVLQDGAIQTKETSSDLVVDAQAFASKISGLSFFGEFLSRKTR